MKNKSKKTTCKVGAMRDCTWWHELTSILLLILVGSISLLLDAKVCESLSWTPNKTKRPLFNGRWVRVWCSYRLIMRKKIDQTDAVGYVREIINLWTYNNFALSFSIPPPANLKIGPLVRNIKICPTQFPTLGGSSEMSYRVEHQNGTILRLKSGGLVSYLVLNSAKRHW